jgi:LysM repeat protein
MPPGWTTYTVVRGNTLFAIARATGSTVGELREVNCITDVDNIQTNDVLFVPRAPNQPVRTVVPRIPDEEEVIALFPVGCGIPSSSIGSPYAGQRVSGSFAVFGTAAHEDFQYYRLEVRPDFTNVYNFYSRSDIPVSNGVLGQINAELFDDGVFWIRLTVVDKTGNFIQPCEIPVIFE